MIDPIVEEVPRYRAEYARNFNFELPAICADIRRFEMACGHEVAELTPKRIGRDKARKECANL